MKESPPGLKTQQRRHGLVLVPPTVPLHRPQLEAHLFQACARRAGYDVGVLYLNLPLAAAFGVAFQESLASLESMPAVIEDYVAALAEDIVGTQTPVVVASAQQAHTGPALALLQAVKTARADVITLFSSPDMEHQDMADLVEDASHVNHFLSGENETSFTMFLTLVVSGNPPQLKHFYGRQRTDLNRVPCPEFGDYFEQKQHFLPHLEQDVWLPYECSRYVDGKLNLKKFNRVLNDFERFAQDYPCRRIYMEDPFMSLYHYETLLPRLAGEAPEFELSFAIKELPDIRGLLALKRGGVWHLRPGGSFGEYLYREQGLGVVYLLRFLRRVQAVNLDVVWEIPAKDDEREREVLLERIRLMHHLPPPLLPARNDDDPFQLHLQREIEAWREAYESEQPPDVRLEVAEDLYVITDSRPCALHPRWVLEEADVKELLSLQLFRDQSLLQEAVERKLALVIADHYVPLFNADTEIFLEFGQPLDLAWEPNPVP